ncbi:immunoglobulin superfamily member 11 isoform X4 [Scomber japonicus]|uniref:immunoglobulin superfamily member 11 isoform X4 n=1 Tax=Scomber japonicus TaxID=13676 RepID=UPI002304EB6B|nr:immunoglobulin superfamily member 11 isoform X4 [Scomber japonicus]
MVIPLSNANQPEQVIIYQGGQVFSLANHLNGRVGFVATMPSTSASIFINNTQLTDTGTYQCLVNNLPDRGGRNIGVIGLTVLVPPSVPACRIQGTLDVGSDIMLICSSDEGIPTPSYSWEKLDALPKLPSNAMQDQMQGTVTLRNISTSTSGLYQLAVTLFYWKNKNKYDEEEIPNEIREDDLPPKRSSSVKAFHADASSSENDTLTSTNTYNSRYWHNPKPNYDTNSYTRYNGDTRQTFSAATHAAHGPTSFANGSHTLPPPKTLVVTTNSAPSPPTMVRSNGSVSLKPVVTSTHGQHTHSYAVSQATLERMGAVPVMVPAQSRAGSLV